MLFGEIHTLMSTYLNCKTQRLPPDKNVVPTTAGNSNSKTD